MELTEEELELVRQWYTTIRDVHPGYLERADVDLYIKVSNKLGVKYSPRDVDVPNDKAIS